jgi:hypothetical protein
MRGLTTEERDQLTRWRDRVYRGVTVGKLHEHRTPVEQALFARGLADWEDVSPVRVRAVATPLGELALRVDAAARARGVWS